MIKVMLDTNILVSIFILKSSIISECIKKMEMTNKFKIVIDNYSLDEFIDVITRKFFKNVEMIKKTVKGIEEILLNIDFIPTFTDRKTLGEYVNIRDKKDIPIINAALSQNVNILLTGDKDFYVSKYDNLTIMTPKEFECLINNRG
jgi:putative PIN family toxin of toxin-antitoxin system